MTPTQSTLLATLRSLFHWTKPVAAARNDAIRFNAGVATNDREPTAQPKDIKFSLNSDGSLVYLDPGSWFVCFVPAIGKEWWHVLVHRIHMHVFAIRPAGGGEWTLFEPWWTRLLVATITTEQAIKFLRWGAKGDVLLVRESIAGHSSQLRGWMTCAALAAHMLGRTYFLSGLRINCIGACSARRMSARWMFPFFCNGIWMN